MWIIILFSCSGTSSEESGLATPTHELVPVSTAQEAPKPLDDRYPDRLSLDGQTVSVRWDDGDTFTIQPKEEKEKVVARLYGYNTLESYGPVHRWGDWTGVELYRLAKAPGVRASSKEWSCEKREGGGGYGRILVDCPNLKLDLLAAGLAHNFAIDSEPEERYLAAQAEAIDNQVGMWAKGIPEQIITSLHSNHERPGEPRAYDRLVSPLTGLTKKHIHTEDYSSCQEVCHHGSCMVYVPYKERHGDKRAECLALPGAGD